MLYTFNLYNVVCRIYFNNKQTKPPKQTDRIARFVHLIFLPHVASTVLDLEPRLADLHTHVGHPQEKAGTERLAGALKGWGCSDGSHAFPLPHCLSRPSLRLWTSQPFGYFGVDLPRFLLRLFSVHFTQLPHF